MLYSKSLSLSLSLSHTHTHTSCDSYPPYKQELRQLRSWGEYGKGSNIDSLRVLPGPLRFSLVDSHRCWSMIELEQPAHRKIWFERQNLQESLRGLQEKFRCPGSLAWLKKIQGYDSSHHCHNLYTIFIRWNVILHKCSTACNSGTARWKTSFQSNVIEQHELQNGGWIMGIGPSEPKCPTVSTRHFLWALANSMHKTVHRWTYEHLQVMGLKWEDRRVVLSSDLSRRMT